MTTIKTITQEHLESTLLNISKSYEREMNAEISRFRDDCVLSDIGKNYSLASCSLSRIYNHYSSELFGIDRLMGFCCDSSEMFGSMSSSFAVYFTSMLDELTSIFLSTTKYSLADAEIPEKDEINFLDTDSSILAPLTGSESDEQLSAIISNAVVEFIPEPMPNYRRFKITLSNGGIINISARNQKHAKSFARFLEPSGNAEQSLIELLVDGVPVSCKEAA
ncbi:MAG: hypothetical protein EPN89_04570 [Methylovulum sp.]|nr:MAG: hypothetical protein EPN89_04570 [Methylovulum sp.]